MLPKALVWQFVPDESFSFFKQVLTKLNSNTHLVYDTNKHMMKKSEPGVWFIYLKCNKAHAESNDKQLL
jgi:hypothetical protein